MIAPLIALVVGLAGFGVCVFLLRKVDAVISDIYARDRIRWQELGSPTGYFWRPVEKVPFWESVRARDAISVTALLSPDELRRHFLGELPSRPNQTPQRNAGCRPLSDDSPASETPSSPGPRGSSLTLGQF